ncbi:T9SS type A sorting domain-containing protein [Spirosoma oryzicola]|uniref:T9SS type A sorting domain-containing protein n=1 Tax=Spirosoma oryzicola TaxID=2898794 RepID=UPI001E5BB624|nr:T9SS type A sorting domain-containing protein [Spirosoma oryzicola]UHG93166.1 T9SS type A sorting domain-containing protein [Spirosoma oryzicola]
MRLQPVVLVRCLLGLLSLMTADALAQQVCADRLTFTPVNVPNQINWSSFPDFTLPFPVIYGGPRFADSQASPLRHGFSHLVTARDNEVGSLVTARQRANVYYGFATDINQPWETLFSPWNNDLNAYRAKWDRYLSSLASGQKNAAGQYIIPFSRFALDIERILPSDTRILALKQNAAIPDTYRQLSDAAFVTAYKTAMRNLYAEGITYVRQHTDLTNTSVTSYADTPILNTYLNVIGNTWTDWTTNLSRVNYLVKESENSGVGGPYYNQLDALSPSAYYYYDYPNPLARDYLPYLLFQVEVNRAWSNKPVVPWVWMRYHDSSSSYPNFIQPFMAEATAIFPFFSGASGLWLWENPSFEQTRTDTYAAYEHFTHGLYRLSRFADMFQGAYELVIETPARDLMDKQLPVWRGVVKDNKILIAAHNSYATSDDQKTSLVVRYKSWQRTIELTGREVYLCQFDMSAVTANEPIFASVSVSPNPASTELTVTFPQLPNTPTELELLTIQGQTVAKKTVATSREVIATAHLPAGLYVLNIKNERGSYTQRVLLTR